MTVPGEVTVLQPIWLSTPTSAPSLRRPVSALVPSGCRIATAPCVTLTLASRTPAARFTFRPGKRSLPRSVPGRGCSRVSDLGSGTDNRGPANIGSGLDPGTVGDFDVAADERARLYLAPDPRPHDRSQVLRQASQHIPRVEASGEKLPVRRVRDVGQVSWRADTHLRLRHTGSACQPGGAGRTAALGLPGCGDGRDSSPAALARRA